MFTPPPLHHTRGLETLESHSSNTVQISERSFYRHLVEDGAVLSMRRGESKYELKILVKSNLASSGRMPVIIPTEFRLPWHTSGPSPLLRGRRLEPAKSRVPSRRPLTGKDR